MKADESIESLKLKLGKEGYIADDDILVPLFIALRLNKPLLLEGDPGCGKTELAKALTSSFGVKLIRLQCYEGLDASSAIYDWNYQKQMIAIRLAEAKRSKTNVERQIFSEEFLVPRPLLATILACNASKKRDPLISPAVLLIDEVDRSDEEFEGLLLEFLGEFQVTVPEIGTFKAKTPPLVIITSNRTRDLGDGLRRRCIYSYVTYPSKEKEMAIVSTRVPESSEELRNKVVSFVDTLRADTEVFKKPGISETIDWTDSLLALGVGVSSNAPLEESIVKETISVLLKDPEDLRKYDDQRIHGALSKL